MVGFLPTLQIERLHLSTSTAATVTALVTIVNVSGNLASARRIVVKIGSSTLVDAATGALRDAWLAAFAVNHLAMYFG